MPAGVVKSKKEEKIWEYKKKQVAKQTGKKSSQFSSLEWRRVNFLFQKAKRKYKGKLPKKYTQTFRIAISAAYKIEIKPLEHFDKCGHLPTWSIQTEQTHGRKGIIRVSRSKLEDPGMSMNVRPDYQRMAGAEDIFQGNKINLLAYIHNTYKGFTSVEFAK